MWTYVYTDRNNDFLAHAGRKGMKWGKHIFGNAAEEMRNAIARAKASAPAQTNVTSSGRKRNVSGEATGSLERREAVGSGSVNPNGAYNRATSASTSNTSSNGPKLFDDTAAKITSDKARYEESKRTSPNGLQGRKRNVSGEATGSMERRDTVGRTTEQRDAFNQWNNRSDVAKKFEEMKRRLKLTSRSKAVRHSGVWTYRYTDYNNDYEDFLIHHGILGQKWGVRRYQNKDGSLTAAGRARYLSDNTNQSIAKDRKFMKNDQDYDEETYQKVSSMHEARLDYKQNKTKENKIAYKKAKNDAWNALQLESGKQLYNKGETQASIFMKTAGKTLLKSLGAVAASAAIGFGIGAVASTLGMSVQTAQGVAVLASLPISVIAGVSVRKDEVRGYRQRKALDQYTRKINGG